MQNDQHVSDVWQRLWQWTWHMSHVPRIFFTYSRTKNFFHHW